MADQRQSPMGVVEQSADLFDTQELSNDFQGVQGFQGTQQPACSACDQGTASACSEGSDSGPCWGALLTGGATCTPEFHIGKLYFKDKFCDNVRYEQSPTRQTLP